MVSKWNPSEVSWLLTENTKTWLLPQTFESKTGVGGRWGPRIYVYNQQPNSGDYNAHWCLGITIIDQPWIGTHHNNSKVLHLSHDKIDFCIILGNIQYLKVKPWFWMTALVQSFHKAPQLNQLPHIAWPKQLLRALPLWTLGGPASKHTSGRRKDWSVFLSYSF